MARETESGPQGRDRRGRRGTLRGLEPRRRAHRLRADTVQDRGGPQASRHQVPCGHPSFRGGDRDHQPLQPLRRVRSSWSSCRSSTSPAACSAISWQGGSAGCSDLPRLATLRPLHRSRCRRGAHRRRRVALPGRLRLGRRLGDNPAPPRKRPPGAPDLKAGLERAAGLLKPRAFQQFSKPPGFARRLVSTPASTRQRRSHTQPSTVTNDVEPFPPQREHDQSE